MLALPSFSRWTRAIVAAGAVALVVLVVLWRFFGQASPLPQHPLRIGFENNPPVQIRTDGGYAGLAVETVNEAAKRAGIQLQWVETGTSSEEALRKGLVDLWPLMVDLPNRRKYIHFARPWMHSSNVLLLRAGTPNPDRTSTVPIGVYNIPLHIRLLHSQFPAAQIVLVPEITDILKDICTGTVAAGFFEARVALSELRTKPAECASADLRVQTIPDLRFGAGVASTFRAAGAADRIQREIDNMFRDGALAELIAKYSYFGLDDAWASYERVEAEKNWELLASGIGALLFAAGVVFWLASSLRQRKQAERALRESEDRFRSLANTAPVMIVASDPDGRANFFNRTWLDFTGRSNEQELGYGWMESVHPEDRDRTLSEISSSFATLGNCKVEYRLLRADGEYRHVMCSGVPRFTPDGVFAGYIASCIDLTEIKAAQEEARERQNLESLGVLARGIAHDFNNLLGATLALSELAEEKLAEETSPEEELRKIGEVAIRGSEIVRQLMIFSGNESGVVEPVDISSLVKEMVEFLKVSISKHAVLKMSLAKDLRPVDGNAAQLRQVVMNLVTNASEAIREVDGVIHVQTETVTVGPDSNVAEAKRLREGDYLQLEVSDTGCGMTAETQRRMFDPFFTTKFAGRGMGLAVVQQIVKQHSGAIQVTSSRGQGTTIQVLLPHTQEPARVDHEDEAVGSLSRAFGSEVPNAILVVEDEPALMESISKLLVNRGFRVFQAGNGSAALERICMQDELGAMLLDVTLPGVSSREVYEEAERLRPELPVILTSAYSEESVRASFTGLTIPYFIRKPFHVDSLVRMIGESRAARSSPTDHLA